MSFSRIPSRTSRTHWGLPSLVPALLILGCLATAGRPPSTVLRPGIPLEREILPGEEQPYPIELAAGALLLVDVEQEGIDVEVTLLDPVDDVVIRVDSPDPYRDSSTEHLAAIARTSGIYKILIKGDRKGAPGRHRIRIEEPRPARDGDSRRIEAVEANFDASLAMRDRSEESRRHQAELREKALGIWRNLGERRRVAETLLQLGAVETQLGRKEAVDRLREAATIWAQEGDARWQARALNEAAYMSLELGLTEHVREDLDRALELARQSNDPLCEKRILNNRGKLLKNSGEATAALRDLQKALELADVLGEKDCRASTLVNLGSLYQTLGNLPNALEHYRKALELPCIQGSDQTHTRTSALNNLGAAHEWYGDYERALSYYLQALELSRGAEKAKTLHNLAVVYKDLDDLVKSRETFLEALSLIRQIGDPELEATSRLSLGKVYSLEGRHEDAIREWEEAARIGNPEDLISLSAQVNAQIARGDLEKARITIDRLREIAHQHGDVAWEAHTIFLLAGIQRRQGELLQAAASAESAVDLLETIRGRIPSPEMRAQLLASGQTYYSFYIDTLMELDRHHAGQGYDAQALQVSERARARSLLDMLSESRTEIQKGANPELLRRERQLSDEVRALDVFYLELVHDGASPERIEEAKRRLDDALDRHAQVELELRTQDQHYAALTQPKPLTAAEVEREVLGPGTLLLEYALGDEQSYLWAVTPGTVRSFQLPGRAQIEAHARSLYEAWSTNPTGTTKAQKEANEHLADEKALALSRMILGEVEPLLGNHRLIVVADGVLQYIPFAALPLPSSPQQRIVHRNDVVSLPSASTLAVLRRELADRPPAPKTIAILADPVFEKDSRLMQVQAGMKPPVVRDPQRGLPLSNLASGSQPDLLALDDLPNSREEAIAIEKLVPKNQCWMALGYEASRANAMGGRLMDYRYVHFATHGILDTTRPELSRLALSRFNEKGEPLNDSLTLQDIYNLELNADLVVLSACETALGKEVRGEGLIGLTRGFMYAGARRVMASLWSVDDRATRKLMVSFYRHLLKNRRDPAAALRQAQLETAKWRPSPYYWAGFSLQGEWK
jgi:CHAT domain-containing protein